MNYRTAPLFPSSLAPGALLRLLAAPRAALAVLFAAFYSLGFGWVGSVAYYNAANYDPRLESAFFSAHLAALALVGIPSLVAIVIGEVVQESYRRPVINRLPGVGRRMAGSALLIGLCAVLLCCVGVLGLWDAAGCRLLGSGPTRPGPLAALALALSGFAAGLWVLVRIGSGWGWLLRMAGFFALAYYALPLLSASSGALPLALSIAAVAYLTATQRFHPAIMRRTAQVGGPTVLAPMGKRAQDGDQGRAVRAAHGDLMPRAHLSGRTSGWLCAGTFEARTARGDSLWKFTAVVFLLLLVGPFASWMLGGSGQHGLPLWLAAGLLDLPQMQDEAPLFGSFFVILGGAAFLQAFLVTLPLRSGLLYPLSRSTRASVVFQRALRKGLSQAAAILVTGMGLGYGLAHLGGAALPVGIPKMVIVVLVNLLLFPVYVMTWLHLLRAARTQRMWRVALLYATPLPVVMILSSNGLAMWTSAPQSPPALLIWTGFAGLVTLSFWLLSAILRRHYARVDLA